MKSCCTSANFTRASTVEARLSPLADAVSVPLAVGAVRVLDLEPGSVIRCLQGQAWITLDGDGCDYRLSPGQTYRPTRRVRPVLQAIGGPALVVTSRLDATADEPSSAASPWRWLRTVMSRSRA